MNRLCFLCCTQNTKIPFTQLTHDRAVVKLLNIPDYNGLANYVYITSNTANWHTRKGRGDGSWNSTMGVWNGKVMKTRTINSTSKLHTAVRHVNKCAVYDTRYTGGPPYTRLAVAQKKIWKIKEINGS